MPPGGSRKDNGKGIVSRKTKLVEKGFGREGFLWDSPGLSRKDGAISKIFLNSRLINFHQEEVTGDVSMLADHL